MPYSYKTVRIARQTYNINRQTNSMFNFNPLSLSIKPCFHPLLFPPCFPLPLYQTILQPLLLSHCSPLPYPLLHFNPLPNPHPNPTQILSPFHLRASFPEDADGVGSPAVSRQAEAGLQGAEAPPDGSQEYGPSQEAQQRPREQDHRAAATHYRTGWSASQNKLVDDDGEVENYMMDSCYNCLKFNSLLMMTFIKKMCF